MAITVNINGQNFEIPQTSETGWGDQVTAWIAAASSGLLQKAGGNFTLTANTNFGPTFGVFLKFLSSRTASAASGGVIRLANNEEISWRNAANSANLSLKVGVNNKLYYNGVEIVDISTAQTLENKTLVSPVINTGVSGTAISDDGAMSAGSSTLLATQRAIKAYVSSATAAASSGFRVDLLELGVETTLPTGVVVIDGVPVTDKMLVLFLGLTTGNNRVYEATVVAGSVVSWEAVPGFTGGVVDPSVGDLVKILKGLSGKLLSYVFDGTDFVDYSTTINHFQLKNIGTLDHEQLDALVTPLGELSDDSVVITDENGIVASSAITATELSYLNEATGNIQSQLNAKEPTVTKGNLTEATSSVLTITGGTGAVIGSGTSVQVKKASNSQAGYLDSLDFRRIAWAGASGLLTGGALTINANTTKFNIAAGTGVIYDNYTNPNAPVVYEVSWNAINGTVPTGLLTQGATAVAIDKDGTIRQALVEFTPEQRRKWILLGTAIHTNRTTIDSVIDVSPNVRPWDIGSTLSDMGYAVGPINKSGNVYSANGANRKIDKNSGEVFQLGVGTKAGSFEPNRLLTSSLTQALFLYT